MPQRESGPTIFDQVGQGLYDWMGTAPIEARRRASAAGEQTTPGPIADPSTAAAPPPDSERAALMAPPRPREPVPPGLFPSGPPFDLSTVQTPGMDTLASRGLPGMSSSALAPRGTPGRSTSSLSPGRTEEAGEPGGDSDIKDAVQRAMQGAGVKALQGAESRKTDLLTALSEGGAGIGLLGESLAEYGTGQDLDFAQLEQDPAKRVIAEREDIMSPEELELLERYKIKVPPGMKRSEFAKLMPQIASQVMSPYQKISTAQRQQALDYTGERLDVQRTNTAARIKTLLDVTIPKMLKAFKDPGAAGRKRFADMDASLRGIQRVRNLRAQGADPGAVGGRVDGILVRLGVADPLTAQFSAETQNLTSELARYLSGVAVPPEEYKRIAGMMAQMWQRGDTFDALLDRFETQILASAQAEIGSHSAAGFNMEGFSEMFDDAAGGVQSSVAPTNGAGGLKAYDAAGNAVGKIPPGATEEDIQEYLDSHKGHTVR